MSARIFRSILAVSLAVLAACFVIIIGVMSQYYNSVQARQLSAQAELAARGVEEGGAAYLSSLHFGDYRLTLISAEGQVLFDSVSDPAEMENHLGREEIDEALEYGAGESERYSSTLSEKTIYHARRLSDGTLLRISVTQYTMLTLFVSMLQPLVIVMALAILLSALLARRLTRRIVEPLGSLDLEHPTETETYEELAPLLTRIERQQRQIGEQLARLRRARDEFSAVTENMSEGLVLLNEKAEILSINSAAKKLFGADDSALGRDMLTLDRSTAMQGLIASALSGRREEGLVERGGGLYQLDLSPVFSEGRVSGAVLLIFDVTERALAERQRREFSANVSHELKTPLQSIMGSAELLQNGLVKEEDVPGFAGRIHSEAARLVTLINDIIRLSELDEGAQAQAEEVELLSVAQEAAEALRDAAARSGLTLELSGGPALVPGVRRMIYEIVYNLCDNAIKYNREGGFVRISVEDGADFAQLRVSDNGIGIPEEQQSRVFERFYRVDKSHSRQTGGTGLGLSIVKHAAAYHKAALTLQSAPEKGTTVSLRFPK